MPLYRRRICVRSAGAFRRSGATAPFPLPFGPWHGAQNCRKVARPEERASPAGLGSVTTDAVARTAPVATSSRHASAHVGLKREIGLITACRIEQDRRQSV